MSADQFTASIESQILDSIEVKNAIIQNSTLVELIGSLATDCINSIKDSGKLILFGNGGSAADAQHIAAEFVSRFGFDRPALPAIALTVDTSALTAIGNDYGFEKLFERQVQALCSPKDIVIGITTSGRSPNVIEGLRAAKKIGAKTYALTGVDGLTEVGLAKSLRIPSRSTARIQESHILIGHVFCGLVEGELFG